MNIFFLVGCSTLVDVRAESSCKIPKEGLLDRCFSCLTAVAGEPCLLSAEGVQKSVGVTRPSSVAENGCSKRNNTPAPPGLLRCSCPVACDGTLCTSKGPIPGTPVVVADWQAQEQARANGESSSASTPNGSAGRMAEGSSNSGGAGGWDGRQAGGEEDDGKTPSIEKEHVQAVYDTIAPHW